MNEFNPHSVPSSLSVEEQLRIIEARKLLAKAGLTPPESVRATDVDISRVRVPQYETPAGMQKDMEKLGREAEPLPAVLRSNRRSPKSNEEESTPAVFRSNRERSKISEPTMELPPDDDVPLNLFRERYEASDGASITLNPEDAPQHVKEIFDNEGTRKEWRKKLTELIMGAREKAEWWKSSEEHLIRRNAELDAQGEKIGGIDGERIFRKMGEWYNKRNWKTKLAVGAALGLGATVGASASVPLAFACMSGIAVQRFAGFATMYMKFEKKSHDEKWGKEKAMLKAGVYTALMGLAIKEAVEYASGTELAHAAQAKVETLAHAAQAKVEMWLGSMLGHHSAQSLGNLPEKVPPPPIAGMPSVAEPVVVPEVPQPAAAAAAGVAIPAPEVPHTTGLAFGHPSQVPESAPVASVHELPVPAPAVEPSAPIGPPIYEHPAPVEPHLTAPSPEEPPVNIPSEQPVVPPVPPAYESSVVHDSHGHAVLDSYGNPVHLGSYEHPAPTVPTEASAPVIELSEEESLRQAFIPEKPVLETVGPTLEQNLDSENNFELQEETIPEEPPRPPAVDLTKENATVEQPTVPLESSSSVVHDKEGNPVRTGTFEPPPGTNHFGLKIPLNEPHIYADPGAQHMFVFGGSPTVQAETIKSYLISHPNSVVYGTDDTGTYRIPFHLLEGKVTAGPPMRTSGFFGFFSEWMKAPGPEEFGKIIK